MLWATVPFHNKSIFMQEDRNTIIISIAITSIFILLLISFIAFIILMFNRRHIDHQRRISTLKSDFEKTLLATQLEIQEQTFQNISREIHDNIGLSLTLAKLNLNTLSWSNILTTREKVFGSVEFISRAIEDLSYLSKTLNTDFIEENGLLNALEVEIKKIKKLGLFKVEFEVGGSPVYMNTQKELVIFRIIQEVLNNSIKHAQATTLIVSLNYLNDQVIVELGDNGRGFTDSKRSFKVNKGTGLLNIVKRASLIDGRCEVQSEQGKGTRVIMHVPY
jgi:two-component system, NarL family, sensor kinase